MKIDYQKSAYVEVNENTFTKCESCLDPLSNDNRQFIIPLEALINQMQELKESSKQKNFIGDKKFIGFITRLVNKLDPDTGDVFIYPKNKRN